MIPLNQRIAEIMRSNNLGSDEKLERINELIPADLTESWQADNDLLRWVIKHEVMPEVLDLWLKKNADYRGQQVFLGRKAQFADINRKFWKLKTSMWDGESLAFEDEEEIMMDMVGHLMMAIASGRMARSGHG